jgi:asparagine synthetase B (glutamine-hydrolysing)
MCAIIGYVGKVDRHLLSKIVEESRIRGLHNLGKYVLPNAGMYHWRYITSGETNQPLVKHNKYLIFNGVIDMGTKEEMEKRYNCSLQTDNDGELLLELCEYVESVPKFIDNPKVTFAGIIISEGVLYAIRNQGRPLWIAEVDECVYIASTKDIFKRSGIDHCSELEQLKLYAWTI